MKVILLALCIIFFEVPLNAQTKKYYTKPSPPLQTVYSAISFDAQLTQMQGHSRVRTTPIKTIILELTDSISKNLYYQEISLSKKYRKEILNYFSGIQSFGQSENVLADGRGSPFTFASYNKNLTFVQKSVISNYVLNTFKLDADQRALYVIKNIILPSLDNFRPLLNTEIKYFALDVGYRVRDFTDEAAVNTDSADGEQTSILLRKEILLKYINAEISDQEVMKRSIFYNFNNNNKSLKLLSF